MIPLSPDWQGITNELRERYGTDDAIADKLAEQGVITYREVFTKLRLRIQQEPPWNVGAAMLNLLLSSYEIPQSQRPSPRRKK